MTLEISLSDNYAKWLEPRVNAYKELGRVERTIPFAFYKMSYDVKVKTLMNKNYLWIKVYGHQSFSEEWDALFDNFDKNYSNVLTNCERYLGLMFLADILSTIHLRTADIEIRAGEMLRPTAGDLLTDFWFFCYDNSSDSNLRVENCEVCNELFITASRKQKGHPRCMNRKRVKISRAKRFIDLVKRGIDEQEAAKRASISPSTALETIKNLQKS